MARKAASILIAGAFGALLCAAPGATAKACKPVVNPYPGTRYDGVNLRRIRAIGVSCATARRVARGAHRKALGIPPVAPIRRFTWHRWRVSGDLRPASDVYVARRGGRRVKWRF
jgi:hypothetical protein